VFYDIFSLLATRHGSSPTAFAQSLGINKSNVSNWKNNGYMPRGAVLNKIAEAFNVTSDYLLTMSNYTFPDEWEPDCMEDWQNAKSDDEKLRMLSSFGICPAVMKEAEKLLGLTKKSVPGETDILDDVDFAFYGEYKELTENEKETLRDMARVMRERRKKMQGE
jgi:transcriptional regulator with XRE-family HTH domain